MQPRYYFSSSLLRGVKTEWKRKKQQQQGNLAVEKLIVSVKREVALKWSRLRTKASNVQNNARQQKAFAKKSTQNRQELICTLSCFVSLFILRSHATGFRMAICGNFCKVFLKTTGISSDCTDILVKLYCMRGPFTTTKMFYGHTRLVSSNSVAHITWNLGTIIDFNPKFN